MIITAEPISRIRFSYDAVRHTYITRTLLTYLLTGILLMVALNSFLRYVVLVASALHIACGCCFVNIALIQPVTA